MPLISEYQKMLALQVCHEVEHFVGMPWQDIPLSDGILSHANGRDAFILGLGYRQVIDWLWSNIDHSKVEFKPSEEVLRLKKVKEHCILVTTDQSEYEADYVVCTIPIGALKLCQSTLFESLDIPNITKAIQKTNMAAFGKVIVEFPYIFWDEDRDMTFVIHESEGKTECATVVTPYNGIPALIVLTAPPLTQLVESEPQNAFRYIKWAFKHVGNGKTVPEPTNVIVTDWTQNRFFMGSYSARSIGQSYDELVEPFIEGAQQLRFAGEHTVLEGAGCVHAAYNSGLREAEYILNMTKQ